MGEAAFAGKYEPSKDGLDCIAIFDGTGFRLELLSATVKHLRCAGPRLRAGAASGPVPPMTLSLAHASPGGCRMLCTGPGGGLEEARYCGGPVGPWGSADRACMVDEPGFS